ncbi:hypothetical protein [Thalassobacillus sp. C254]|uniref:hypothetical protein n=1 Tax=Thalassobacillus sp. C254 TaxID=1225341 RepID=UPI0006D2A55E|nr:hypothetical protein [Thalassobacillus sp. C254]
MLPAECSSGPGKLSDNNAALAVKKYGFILIMPMLTSTMYKDIAPSEESAHKAVQHRSLFTNSEKTEEGFS